MDVLRRNTRISSTAWKNTISENPYFSTTTPRLRSTTLEILLLLSDTARSPSWYINKTVIKDKKKLINSPYSDRRGKE